MSNSAMPGRIFESPCFKSLYNNPGEQKARFTELHNCFHDKYPDLGYTIFSAPGRTEICGNHTDHNSGKVIAAAVDRDVLCFAAKTADSVISIYDLQYKEHIKVDLASLKPDQNENHSVQALIRGIAAGLDSRGYKYGGFCGCLHSEVLSGSGLSSSAALEILLVSVFNTFYNDSSVDYLEAAHIGQFAENDYFGKPCGLMDQTACSAGGMVFIDFLEQGKPSVRKLGNPFANSDYGLAVVTPGGNHAGLTGYYSDILQEMKNAAAVFGRNDCRGLSLKDLLNKADLVRKKAGDRAFLRAFHYLNENVRVDEMTGALSTGKLDQFMSLVTRSGNSSWKYLQNISVPDTPRKQDLAVALACADLFCSENGGACRVHGGGFAGTIQIFYLIKSGKLLEDYFNSLFGKGCLYFLSIRENGPCVITAEA